MENVTIFPGKMHFFRPCSGWDCEACFLFNSNLFSKLLEKIYDTPIKNTRPGPDQNLYPWSKNILKNVSWSWTGFSAVRWNSGIWVAPQVFTLSGVLPPHCTKQLHNWNSECFPHDWWINGIDSNMFSVYFHEFDVDTTGKLQHKIGHKS